MREDGTDNEGGGEEVGEAAGGCNPNDPEVVEGIEVEAEAPVIVVAPVVPMGGEGDGVNAFPFLLVSLSPARAPEAKAA